MATIVQPIWMVTQEKINEAIRRIVEVARPRKIIAFGSQAWGGTHPDSDLDLMILEDHVKNPIAESVRLRRALKGLIMSVDILVVNQERFDYWRDTPGNIFFEVNAEGKILYEAA